MGLGCNQQGGYVYGGVWDGGLEPGQVYSSRQAFVAWLATQSDYSLAGLESKDPWAWGNQTITRKRLKEFVQQR